jgi:putative transposase
VSKLLRYYALGQTYFVTTVTHERRPILVEHADLFKEALRILRAKLRVEVSAFVLLPDHFHAIVRPDESDPCAWMRRLKLLFASRYLQRLNARRGKVWQRRFWDHVIRDERDWRRHMDYIHFNPVKHGLAKAPSEWSHSSFGDLCSLGVYEPDWGAHQSTDFQGDFGE